MDYIFVENFIMSFLILYQLSIFTKTKVKLIKTFFASFIGAIYVVLVTVFSDTIFSNIIFKLIAINIIIYLAFLPKEIVKYFKICLYFYVIATCYIGSVIVITVFLDIKISGFFVKIIVFISGYIITYLSNKNMWKLWKSNIKNNDLIYEIKVYDKRNDSEITFKAFVDSGNSLKDSVSNTDIFLVQRSIFEQNIIKEKKEVHIPMNTVNGSCVLKGYIYNNIYMFKNGKQVTKLKKAIIIFTDISLSKNNEYSSLISYDTYVEKLQGVEL
ncbi:MAG: sigma-E processing peptidase SpoIIGA [Clostridia bacterium]|nr:sigma-E processing peptidase SpoIIGA [Clostridia bacterium]